MRGLTLGLGITGKAASLIDSLGPSKTLTATGTGVTLSAMGADGRYTIGTTAGFVGGAYISTADDALAGDFVLEIIVGTSLDGAWFGFDNAAPTGNGYVSMDEVLTASFTHFSYWKNGAWQGDSTNYTLGHLWFERVGTSIKLYQGADWPAASASAPLLASTATDATARHFHFSSTAAGTSSFTVRVVDHP